MMLKRHEFTAFGKPKSKERPRMTRSGRTYTPKATLEAEAKLRAQYDGPVFEGPIRVDIEYLNDQTTVIITELDDWENISKSRADIDNLAKLTLDALNGIAWNDDSQVKRITAVKL
jgi:Holliday junction resolvase RusA-like endonuclease